MSFGYTPSVISASYATSTYRLTLVGRQFAEYIYSVSLVEVSLDGITWTPATTFISWADDGAVVQFASALGTGTYRVRVTNSDNNISDPLVDAFTVTSGLNITAITFSDTTATITGSGFSAVQGTGKAFIADAAFTFVTEVAVTSWSDNTIVGTLQRTLNAGSFIVFVFNNVGTVGKYAFVVSSVIEVVNSPSLSVKQRVIDAIEYGMTQIDSSNGYNFTIRQVCSPEQEIGSIVSFPAVAIYEGPDESTNVDRSQTGGNAQVMHNQMDVRIDCVVPTESDPVAARNKILQDIQRYIGNHWWLPGSDNADTAFDCMYLRSEPWGTHESKPLTGVTVYIRVFYDCLMKDPTQVR